MPQQNPPRARTTTRKSRAKPRPLTDAEKQRIKELHAAGYGRNEIARQVNRPYGTITNYCQEEGLSFDRREELKAATEIRLADLADLRAYLAHKLMVTAITTEEQLHLPTKVYSFGGRDNTYNDKDVDEPPPEAKKQLMATVGIAIEKSLKLSPVQEETDVNAAKSMLTTLGEAITKVVREADTADHGKD
jgi:hypothetical protein